MPEMSGNTIIYWVFCILTFAGLGKVRWVFAYYLLIMPGTVLHEFCHWLVAKILKGKPAGFSLLLRKFGDRYVLGEVTFIPGQFNTVFIALAPLLLAPVWAFILPSVVAVAPQAICMGICGGILARSCLPSSQDVKVAFSRPLGFIPLLIIIAGVAKLATI